LDHLIQYIKKNIADHSCFHHYTGIFNKYSQFALQKFLISFSSTAAIAATNSSEQEDQQQEHKQLQTLENVLQRIIKLFYFNQFLITYFPGHEALWCFRRHLWYSFITIALKVQSNLNTNNSSKSMLMQVLNSRELLAQYMEQQMQECDQPDESKYLVNIYFKNMLKQNLLFC